MQTSARGGITARVTGARRSPSRHGGYRGRSRHRDVQGNALRAAVLGAGDGLLTNVSLVLGVAGATSGGSFVRLAGISGLLAGAFSMGAGELVSVRAHDELVQREIEVERAELRDEPEAELRELAAMYRSRGVPAADAMTVAKILSANQDVALDTHARLELGIDPTAGGSSLSAAGSSFASFAFGALLPLLPWLFVSGVTAVIASVVIAAVAALGLGGLIGSMTGRGVVSTALRQLTAAALAAAVTYSVGAALGVHST